MKLDLSSAANFDVFDLNGKKIAAFTARNITEAARLWRDGSVKGAEKMSGICLIRNRSNGMTIRVKAVR